MVKLWGHEYSRAELLQRVGRLSQVGGVEALVLDDGPERGVRALRMHGAAGLSCTLVPDRALDISDFSYNGRSLCWKGAPGRVSPALFNSEADGQGFLRHFFGGMLTTCGLTQWGPADGMDAGEPLYLHDLISVQPASNVAWGESWDGDRCTLYVRGQTRQVKLFHENLTITRHLRMDLDSNTLLLEDVVRNEGWQQTPHMIMYHCNMGYPLLDEGTQLVGNFSEVTPRDEEAKRGLDVYNIFSGPQPDFKEQVFRLKPVAGPDGLAEATIWNPNLDAGLGLRMRWSADTLPWVCEWRMLGQGAYTLGIEPINCPTLEGRAVARAAGTLPFLEPGEERRYRLEFTVITELARR